MGAARMGRKSESSGGRGAAGVLGLLVLSACAGGPKPSLPSTPPAPPPAAPAVRGDRADVRAPASSRAEPDEAGREPGLFIAGEAVSSEAYMDFRSKLEEVDGTWYCDEMSDGGETGWQGEDAQGRRYWVRETTDASGSYSEITPISP